MGWRRDKRWEKENTEGDEKTLGGDGYAHYLDGEVAYVYVKAY